MTPIAVMPICTVDSSLDGSSRSFSAVSAPRLPRSAIAFRRGLREETIAISASAKTPLRRISRTRNRNSIYLRGRGALRGAGDPAGSYLLRYLVEGFNVRFSKPIHRSRRLSHMTKMPAYQRDRQAPQHRTG